MSSVAVLRNALLILICGIGATAEAQRQSGVAGLRADQPQAFEAEGLVAAARATQGQVSVQPMAQFGRGWSGNAQLFWAATQPNAELQLALPSLPAGRYELAVHFTKANDYADLAVLVNGQPASGVFAGFNPSVTPSGRVPFGDVTLGDGRNTLTFRVVGKFARSRNYYSGIDRIELTARQLARPPQPQPETPPAAPTPRPEDPPGLGASLADQIQAFEGFVNRQATRDSWRSYFAFERLAELAAGGGEQLSESERGELVALVERFDKLVGEPRYRSMTEHATFTRLHASLHIRIGKLPPIRVQGNPAALALQWGGMADTQLPLSRFYNSDHTIVVRLMPQYPLAYRAPVLSASGTTAWWAGLTDVGSLTKRPAEIEINIPGDRQTYRFSPIDPGRWYFLAMVRQGNTIQAYFDGWPLLPPLTIPATSAAPAGTLRIGRLDSTAATPMNANAQFFGLVDDVAVFNRALGSVEIANLKDKPSLLGDEANLVAGWNFNVPDTHGALTAGTGSLTRSGPAKLVSVSASRDHAADAAQLPLPHQQRVHELPFLRGEPWKVIQGYAHRDGSHTGYAAFCWDFVRQGTTLYAPIYATAAGQVAEAVRHHPAGAVDSRGGGLGNVVQLEAAAGEIGGYVHLQQHAISPAVKPGAAVRAGQFIGLAGNTGLGADRTAVHDIHLHLGVANLASDPFVTIPIAFSNYEVYADPLEPHEQPKADGKWRLVQRDIPRAGEWVRRPRLGHDLAAVAIAASPSTLADAPDGQLRIDFGHEDVVATIRNLGTQRFSGRRTVRLEIVAFAAVPELLVASREVPQLAAGEEFQLEVKAAVPQTTLRGYVLKLVGGDDDPGNDEYLWLGYTPPTTVR